MAGRKGKPATEEDLVALGFARLPGEWPTFRHQPTTLVLKASYCKRRPFWWFFQNGDWVKTASEVKQFVADYERARGALNDSPQLFPKGIAQELLYRRLASFVDMRKWKNDSFDGVHLIADSPEAWKRRSRHRISERDLHIASQFFRENPTSRDVYLFSDGAVDDFGAPLVAMDGDKYRLWCEWTAWTYLNLDLDGKRSAGRKTQAAENHMITRMQARAGTPMVVSRTHPQVAALLEGTP